jgi:hypothetical protein
MVAKVRERLAVNKQKLQRNYMERINVKMLKEAESKERYRVDVSNRFATLDDFRPDLDINIVWESI